MNNRIEQKFMELKARGEKAFIAFITAGDPNLKVTEQLVEGFEAAGVDIVELGVPFSDPLADGPTIQAASQRSLKKRTTLKKILESVTFVRSKTQIPLALMSYYNPIFHYGEEKFIKDAKKAGVDGLIIPDLPPEEASDLRRFADQYDIALVFFLAPTSTDERIQKVVAAATGFIYYVSLTGVTGVRAQSGVSINQKMRKIKKVTKKPVCVGFGVSTKEQVADYGRVADGVIVGSAIVKKINEQAEHKNCVESVLHFVKGLSGALK